MKVGDLVTYGSWYFKEKKPGIVIESGNTRFRAGFFLIAWSEKNHEWEDIEELVVINESR